MTYAIYYELGEVAGLGVRQHIFVPATSLQNKRISPVFWHREITAQNPNRTWQRVTQPSYRPMGSGEASARDQVAHELEQLEGISSTMKMGLGSASYDVKTAFPILLTDTILLDILEGVAYSSNKVPVALLTQVVAIRRTIKDLPALPGAKQ